MEDCSSLAFSLALLLATSVATSIVMVELCVFEESITTYAIVFHIRLLTALGWVSRVRVGASPQRGLESLYGSMTSMRSLVEKYGFSAYCGVVAHMR